VIASTIGDRQRRRRRPQILQIIFFKSFFSYNFIGLLLNILSPLVIVFHKRLPPEVFASGDHLWWKPSPEASPAASTKGGAIRMKK
jgi:hypothetical protein